MSADRPGQAHPAARQLLGHPRETRRTHLDAAVIGGHEQPEEPELLHLLDELLRVGVGLLEVPHPRPDALVDELADQCHHLALVVVQTAHHASSSPTLTATSRWDTIAGATPSASWDLPSTPVLRSRCTSAADRPSSPRSTSSVCCPTPGAGSGTDRAPCMTTGDLGAR